MKRTAMFIVAASIFLPSILIGIVCLCCGAKYIGTVLIILNGIFLFIILPVMIKYLTIDDDVKSDDTNTRDKIKK